MTQTNFVYGKDTPESRQGSDTILSQCLFLFRNIDGFANFIWVTTSMNGSSLVGKDISYTTAHLDQPNTSKYG